MALKADRFVEATDINNVAPSGVEAGQCLVYQSPQDSGYAVGLGVDLTAPEVVPLGTGLPPSGTKVYGIALTDVENIYAHALLADGSTASGLTQGIGDPISMRVHRNYQKTTQVIGEPVACMKRGWLYSNKITGTPAAGDPAYLDVSGTYGNTQRNSIGQIGKFDTAKDADGYAKVSFNIT